ncbi:hypothetical protein [Comamonas terrae]|uniref:Uncharacterized protein n=1 Tax=Comamonas terrae TaxID=673548 RepID=A0ABW5UUR6_9BURK|nr:hypothetical protein [Comamonas terrae]
MIRPAIEVLGSGALKSYDMALYVLAHGYVVFDTTQQHARDLADEIEKLLALHHIEVEFGTGGSTRIIHFLLDVDSGYSFVEFARWVSMLSLR